MSFNRCIQKREHMTGHARGGLRLLSEEASFWSFSYLTLWGSLSVKCKALCFDKSPQTAWYGDLLFLSWEASMTGRLSSPLGPCKGSGDLNPGPQVCMLRRWHFNHWAIFPAVYHPLQKLFKVCLLPCCGSYTDFLMFVEMKKKKKPKPQPSKQLNIAVHILKSP